MEILRRRGWITNLKIVLGAELQETLKPRAGMFGTLAFVAVRQKQGQARGLPPLVFRGCNVLIDDGLRPVYEIAELRFPHYQGIAGHDRIAIFETEHTFFGKRTVKDFKTRGWRRRRSQFRECCP